MTLSYVFCWQQLISSSFHFYFVPSVRNIQTTTDAKWLSRRADERIQTAGKSSGKMDDIALRASDRVLELIFSYLDLNTLRNCSLVCKKWHRFLNDENNEVWRMHCIRKLAQEALSSDLLSSVPTYKMKLRAFYHAWNPNDGSRNVYIKPNGFTLHR